MDGNMDKKMFDLILQKEIEKAKKSIEMRDYELSKLMELEKNSQKTKKQVLIENLLYLFEKNNDK